MNRRAADGHDQRDHGGEAANTIHAAPYASNACSVVSSMLVSHFVAETYPYKPGTLRR